MYSASLLSIKPRVLFVESSNNARMSARDVFGAGFGGAAPRSNDESFRILPPQFGMLPRCDASSPSAIDFSCGFHASLSSGIRSSSLRVVPIS